MNQGLAALLGSLIGAGAALIANWLVIHSARSEDDRKHLMTVITRLWALADQLWHIEQSLAYAIMEMQIAREQADQAGMADADQKRVRLMADRAPLEREVRSTLAEVRLLRPDLADAAEWLVIRSRTFKIDDEDCQPKRDEAVEKYEAQARRLLIR